MSLVIRLMRTPAFSSVKKSRLSRWRWVNTRIRRRCMTRAASRPVVVDEAPLGVGDADGDHEVDRGVDEDDVEASSGSCPCRSPARRGAGPRRRRSRRRARAARPTASEHGVLAHEHRDRQAPALARARALGEARRRRRGAPARSPGSCRRPAAARRGSRRRGGPPACARGLRAHEPAATAAEAAAPAHQRAPRVVVGRVERRCARGPRRTAGSWRAARRGCPSRRRGPPSSRITRSASAIVDSRWAITSVVRCSQERAERRVDLLFDVHVDRARRVVEHEDRRVEQQGPRDGDALALPARERVAPLAHHGVVAVGELDDELVGVGGPRGGLDLLDGRVGPAVGDVVADRDREEERLVLDDADRGAKRARASRRARRGRRSRRSRR